jgi:TM2 domain-containing membrane protein YozV
MDGGTSAGYPGYPAASPARKNAMIAGFCSSFLPGLGQVYNGQAAKGFVVFLLGIAGLAFFLVPGLIVWLYAMYDAYSVAGKMNTGELEFRETRTLYMVLFIVFAVIVIVIAVLIILAMVMSSLMGQLGPLGGGDFNPLDTSGFI